MTPEAGGILIIGAGGHGKVVADILQRQGESVAGFLEDNPKLWGTECFGLPVLGASTDFLDYKPKGLIVGIGSNKARKHVVEKLSEQSPVRWVNAIHPQAIVASSVRLGHGVVIAAGAAINPDAVLGSHLIINTAATVDHDCTLADYVHIAPGAHLAGGIRVAEGGFIGIGASVIPNLSIGRWTTVGAGAAVVCNIPDAVIAKGVPARWS